MSEASTSERDLAESGEREKAALQKAARAMDWVRMRQIGGYHFAMVVGALTLWGAAVTWAQLTGWMVAEFAALGGALVAGFVLLARAETTGVLSDFYKGCYPICRTLLEACRAAGDSDGASRFEAATEQLGSIAVAPMAMVHDRMEPDSLRNS